MYINILMLLKIDSDDTQALLYSNNRGGLWRVNEAVQNTFVEYENIFRSFTSLEAATRGVL